MIKCPKCKQECEGEALMDEDAYREYQNETINDIKKEEV